MCVLYTHCVINGRAKQCHVFPLNKDLDLGMLISCENQIVRGVTPKAMWVWFVSLGMPTNRWTHEEVKENWVTVPLRLGGASERSGLLCNNDWNKALQCSVVFILFGISESIIWASQVLFCSRFLSRPVLVQVWLTQSNWWFLYRRFEKGLASKTC